MIGSMDDLNAASVDDVAAFFKTYYAPNNAILSIVGDVDTKKTMALVEKYFGSIPSQPPPDAAESVRAAAHGRTAQHDRRSAGAARARRHRLDRVPSADSPDDDALDVLSDVLSGGRSARLNQVIVREKQLATGAAAFLDESRGPSLFQTFGTVAPGKSAADVEAAHLRGDREGEDRPDRRLGNREGAQQRAPERREHRARARCSARFSSAQDALFYNDPNRINTSTERIAEGDRRRRAACRGEVPDEGEPLRDHHHAEAGRSERRSAMTPRPPRIAVLRAALLFALDGCAAAGDEPQASGDGGLRRARRRSRRRSSRSRCRSRRKRTSPTACT